MKKTAFSRFGTFSTGAALALSFSALVACNSDGTNGNGDGGGGDGGNGDGGNGGPPFNITVTRAGTGSGKVTSQPAGIACDGTGSCSASFPGGTTVTLTAQGQGTGSSFSGWTGACAGQSAACQLAPTGDVTTTANFGELSCTPDSICWEAPLPFGMDLNDVFAISANDVWAVGASGSAVHYNGTGWKRATTGTQQDLRGVWARSASEVWVAGGPGGLVLRYDGNNWTSVNTGYTDFTNGIFGAAPNFVYVSTNTTNILHYNGTTWTSRNANMRANGHIRSISGSSSSDVWTWDDDCGKSHWNGSAWAALNPLDPSWCPTGVVSFGTNNAYAMSANNTFYKYTGGNNFNLVTAIAGGISIKGLWGLAANSLFSSGETGILYRYDGTTWSPIQTTAREVVVYNREHGTSATDVWAVGARGVITHFDGTTPTSPRANVFTADIGNVFGLSATNVYFVTKGRTLIHYDGVSYNESAPVVTGSGADLVRMHGSAADDLWLVGSDAGDKPILLHDTGTGFKPTDMDSLIPQIETKIASIWAGSKQVVWAAGAGFIQPLKWDGSKWQIDFSVNPPGAIRALWGSAINDVWFAADTAVFRHNGTSWGQTSLTAEIFSIHGTSASDVWAGGDNKVYHWNGSSWGAAMAIPNCMGHIVSITATATNDVWFIDQTSQVFRYNGSTFTRVNTSLGSINREMYSWAANANNVWFGGRGILSYRR